MSRVFRFPRWPLPFVTAIALGMSVFAFRSPGQDRPESKPRTRPEVKAPLDDPRWKALARSRIETCQRIVDQLVSRAEAMNDLASIPELAVWSRRLMERKLEMASTRDARIAAMREHRLRMRQLERRAEDYAKTGQCRESDALQAKDFRLEAEQILLEQGVDPDLRDEPAAAKAGSPGVPPSPPAPPR